jgi:hypothetical protein
MRVPLRSIRFRNGGEVTMRLLFWRRISRLGTSGSWPEIPPGQSVFNIQSPALFQGLSSQLLLEVLPSVTYGSSRQREASPAWENRETDQDFGVGAKYGLSSSMTLEATYNPDFSQVESDAFQAEVNRRFPVFFEEKRPFFMEGLDVFDFAIIGHGQMETPVHTRRVVDPRWGSKLSGTVGRTAISLLAASDEFPGYAWSIGVNPNQGERAGFLIGRAKYALSGDSYLGTLYSGRSFADGNNRVLGADTSLRFGDHHRSTFSALYSRTGEPGTGSSDGAGVNWSYNYGTRSFNAGAAFEHYDAQFRMDSAFLRRTGIKHGWVWLSPNVFPNPERWPWLLRISPEVVFSRLYDTTTGQYDDYFSLAANTSFTRQGFLRTQFIRSTEGWQGEMFSIQTLAANGNVQMWQWLRFGGAVGLGDRIYYPGSPAYLGRYRLAALWILLQPNEKLSQFVEVVHEDFRNPTGDQLVYDLNIINGRTTYQFNRYFFLRGIVQYNSLDERLLTDFLASFTFIPGTVIHLGYGSVYERREGQGGSWNYGQGDFLELRRGLFFKASYLWRF